MGIKMKRSFLFRKDSTIIDTFTSRIIVFMDRVCNRCIPDLSMAHRCREMEAIRRRNTWTVNDDEPSPPFLSTIFSNDLARLYSKQWNYSQIIRKAGGLVIFILLFFFLWLFPIRWFVLIERFREMWRGLVWRQFFLLLFFFFTFLRGRKSSWHCFFGERRKEERHPLRLR